MRNGAKIAILLGWSAAAAWGQQPRIENATVERHALLGGLAEQLARFGAGPFWAGYEEPTIAGQRGNMCAEWSGGGVSGSPITRLEGQTALVVLIRVENSQVDRLRVSSPDCALDAGGLAFHWMENVPVSASLAWLRTQVNERHPDPAVSAMALHAGALADAALEELTGAAQPEKIREKAAFWLGTSRGAHGVEALKRMLARETSQKVREQVVFALSQSKDPAGMAAVFDAAKNDRDARIRSRALFWLAQKAGNKQAGAAIAVAAANDPELSVKEQAVFALKQLPEAEGVPLLIEVAKNNGDPAVRKKAMFWLGQSTDPRALDFFAQVLR